jgi:hypothetical protein
MRRVNVFKAAIAISKELVINNAPGLSYFLRIKLYDFVEKKVRSPGA